MKCIRRFPRRRLHTWCQLFVGLLGVMQIFTAPPVMAATGDWQCSDINQQGHQRYHRIINQAERRFGLDAALIAAVIQVESNFDPYARSPVGARGLMQLMPQTQKALKVQDVYDPQQSIEGGTRYLREQIIRFGAVHKGLWAYNAGPQRVKSKVLPSETRRYIPKVLYYYWCLKRQES